MSPGYRAPATAALARIEAALAEDAKCGVEWAGLDTKLVLALLRYAMAHGAVTVGDLENCHGIRVTS